MRRRVHHVPVATPWIGRARSGMMRSRERVTIRSATASGSPGLAPGLRLRNFGLPRPIGVRNVVGPAIGRCDAKGLEWPGREESADIVGSHSLPPIRRRIIPCRPHPWIAFVRPRAMSKSPTAGTSMARRAKP